jgi:ribosomal protein S2
VEVLFVGTNRHLLQSSQNKQSVVMHTILTAGCGMLTNWNTVQNRIERLKF